MLPHAYEDEDIAWDKEIRQSNDWGVMHSYR